MNNRITASLLFACSLSIALLSCNGSDPAKKQRTNKLNVRLEAKVDKVSPILKSTAYARYIANNVFQTLGTFEPETIELQPLLIKSIPEATTVADGKFKGMQQYDFELRDEAKWDNGTPVTAVDIEFSYKNILNPLLGSQFKPYLETLKGFEADATNPKKFKVYLSEYYFLAVEALCQMPIYPKYNYDPKGLLDNIKLEDLADAKKSELLGKQDHNLQDYTTFFQSTELNATPSTISGSGPYRISFFDPAQGAILVKKTDWWANGLSATQPYIAAFPDTLHYKLVIAEDAAINMLRSGDLDVSTNLTPANFKKLEADPEMSAKYNFKLQPSPIYNRIIINTTDPILSDKKVRQALAYSMDYDNILKEIQLGLAQRTVGPIFPGHASYNKDLVPYPFNISKAKALLEEAGWSDTDSDGVADKVINGKKTPLELELMNTTGVGVGDMITASITASLAKAGIKIKAKPTEITKILAETTAGNFQLAANASSAHPGEMDLTQTHHSKNLAPKGDNRMRYANAELDALVDKMKITKDKNERYAISKSIQAILFEDLPEVYLYCPGMRIVASKAFDFQFSPMRPGYLEPLSKLKQ